MKYNVLLYSKSNLSKLGQIIQIASNIGIQISMHQQ